MLRSALSHICIGALVLAAGSAASRAQVTPGYTISRVGLTGPEYVAPNGSTQQFASFRNGMVFGSSQRMNDSGFNGDAWVWSFGQTIPIGLRGVGYRFSQSLRINALGQIGGLTSFGSPDDESRRLDAWVWNGQQSVLVGLTGPGYTGSTGYRFSSFEQTEFNIFRSDAILGFSARVQGVSSEIGRDWWVWDGTRTVPLVLPGVEYIGPSGFANSQPIDVTASGRIIGRSMRYRPDGFPHGSDAWLWDGQSLRRLGLVGAPWEDPTGFRFGSAIAQNESGWVVGRSTAYFPNNERRADAWLFDGTNTTRIGLTGGVYDLPRADTTAALLSQSGSIVGSSRDPVANRETTWILTGGQLTQIALTNPPGESYQGLLPRLLSETGMIAGVVLRSNTTPAQQGQDAWVWDGTQVHLLGLREPEHILRGQRVSDVYQITRDGRVLGASRVFPLSGSIGGDFADDLWLWERGTTSRLGIFDPAHVGFDGYRRVYGAAHPDAPYAWGHTLRFQPDDVALGVDPWVWENGVHTRVGLVGPSYTSSNGLQESWISSTDHVGRLIGRSLRFSAAGDNLGQTAFYFDPATRTSIPVEPSVRSADGYAFSSFSQLTTDGYAIGTYKFFAHGEGEGVSRAIAFRPDVGVVHLEDLVTGGIAAMGFASLSSAWFDEAAAVFVGEGTLLGQPQTQAAFVMTRPQGCDNTDFNNDGVYPSDEDYVAFFAALSGDVCATCNDIDFNNNGVFPEDQDIIGFVSDGVVCP
jgi:hypothetical protein